MTNALTAKIVIFYVGIGLLVVGVLMVVYGVFLIVKIRKAKQGNISLG